MPGEVADMLVTAESKKHLTGASKHTWEKFNGGLGARTQNLPCDEALVANMIVKFRDHQQTPRSWGRGTEQILPHNLVENLPCCHLDLGLQPPDCETICFHRLSHPVCGTL